MLTPSERWEYFNLYIYIYIYIYIWFYGCCTHFNVTYLLEFSGPIWEWTMFVGLSGWLDTIRTTKNVCVINFRSLNELGICVYLSVMSQWTCVYLHVSMDLCMYAPCTCMCLYVPMDLNIYICLNGFVYVCMSQCTCVFLHVPMDLYIFACPNRLVYVCMSQWTCVFLYVSMDLCMSQWTCVCLYVPMDLYVCMFHWTRVCMYISVIPPSGLVFISKWTCVCMYVSVFMPQSTCVCMYSDDVLICTCVFMRVCYGVHVFECFILMDTRARHNVGHHKGLQLILLFCFMLVILGWKI